MMRICIPIRCAAGLVGVAYILAFAQSVHSETPVDRFMAGLDKRTNLSGEQRELIRSTWSKCDGCDQAEFLTQGLALLSPPFRAGLDVYDAEEFSKSAATMHELVESDDPFLSTNAVVYEIKALVADERFAEAMEVLKAIPSSLPTAPAIDGEPLKNVDVLQYSYFTAEVEFLRGVSLLADLRYTEAAKVLLAFLKQYPDASPRLTVAAQQMLTELSHREPESIGEVLDLMNYSRQRLSQGTSDDVVQGRQKRILDLLERLIDEAEKQEKQKSGSGSGGGSGSQGGKSPSNPMQQSMLPGGPGNEGTLREPRHASPGDAWGAMPAAERERVLQALRESFPARYRQLVEQYYEEMAKKP